MSMGTANFYNLYTTEEAAAGIEGYTKRYGIEDIDQLTGAVK